jgi:hypothetical protein
MILGSRREASIPRDIFISVLLAITVLIGMLVGKYGREVLVLLDEETIRYSSEYVQSFDGLRDSIVAANIAQFMFWAIAGVMAYSLLLLFFRSIGNIRRFYVVERFYINKKNPFYVDMLQIITESIVILIAALLTTLSLFFFIPFWLELLVLAVAYSPPILGTNMVLFILFSMSFTFYVILLNYRTYVYIRRYGLTSI